MDEKNEQSSEQFDLNTTEGAQGLYDSIMSPEVETLVPTAGNDENTEVPESEGVKSEDQNSEGEFVLKHPNFENGERSFTKDKVLDYAQKGFDYEAKMNQYKTETKEFESKRTELETREKQLEEKYEYWSKIDQYMSENPRFAELVQRAWAQEQNQTYTPPNPEVEALKEKLSHMEQALAERDQQEKEKATQKLSENLDKSIADYKERYSSLDWKTKDEFGKDLQQRIEDHAVENKFPTFTAAANDLLFDKIVSLKALEAKEQLGKKIQKDRKNGLGPKTDQPRAKGDGVNSIDTSAMSWQQLADHAVKELALA